MFTATLSAATVIVFGQVLNRVGKIAGFVLKGKDFWMCTAHPDQIFVGVPTPGFVHVRPILLSNEISVLSALLRSPIRRTQLLTKVPCLSRTGVFWPALGRFSTVQPSCYAIPLFSALVIAVCYS